MIATTQASGPSTAALHTDLRRLREQRPEPRLAVVSGSGGLDRHHHALAEQTLVLSEQGAARLGGRLPASATMSRSEPSR